MSTDSTTDEKLGAGGTIAPAAPAVFDIHCHILPGIDDGPQTLEQALELVQSMIADGTSAAVATPHELGPYDVRNGSADIRAAVADFNDALLAHHIPFHVLAGGEVRVDGRLLQLLEEDRIMTLGDHNKHVLLELPGEPLIDLRPVLVELRNRRLTAIIAHPERIQSLRRRFDMVRAFAGLGAVYQVNAASLVGEEGPGARDAAWKMIDEGLVDFVASDAHSVDRRPSLFGEARQMLQSRAGYSVMRRICVDNPAAVFRGDAIRTRFNLSMARMRP
jgi:protein-tyrosine phosphatase